MIRLPEVEPLGDVRWARIEQSLMQRLEEVPAREPQRAAETVRAHLRSPSRPRSRVWPVALVATFAVSAAAAVALHVIRPSMHAATSRVVTEASPSHVTIAENSLDVSPESGIIVTEEEHATVLTLERGEVSLHVAPREKDRPFLVEAGDVHVRVVGTEFTVRRVGVGATVAVRHGVVEVREHGELSLVRGGEHWPDGAKDAVVAPAVSPAPMAAPVGAGVPVAPTAPPAPIAATTITSTAPATMTAPVAALRSPHPPGPPPRKQGGGNVDGAESLEDTSSPALPAGRGPGGGVVPDALLPPEPSAQSQYEAAAQLERSDPSRALRLYTDGRLQADRGARGDAARLLEEYLRRFPRGSNAQDARALRESLR
jgi:hypothetical protein